MLQQWQDSYPSRQDHQPTALTNTAIFPLHPPWVRRRVGVLWLALQLTWCSDYHAHHPEVTHCLRLPVSALHGDNTGHWCYDQDTALDVFGLHRSNIDSAILNWHADAILMTFMSWYSSVVWLRNLYASFYAFMCNYRFISILKQNHSIPHYFLYLCIPTHTEKSHGGIGGPCSFGA